jgi:HmuY protein
MNRFTFAFAPFVVCAAFAACSSSTTTTATPGADGGTDEDAAVAVEAGAGTQCTAARQQALLPINKVSTGAVSVVSETAGTKLLYVDASAGGSGAASKSPRVYLNLETATRVDLTDTEAFTSMEWDLALKRSVLYTNSGDAGIGAGGGAEIGKSFSAVTAADAKGLAPEAFFDDQCTLQTDQIGGPLTTFSNWYEYDQATSAVTPKDLTYIVKGGTGKLYKIAITSFAGLADGGTGAATGMFLIQVAPL